MNIFYKICRYALLTTITMTSYGTVPSDPQLLNDWKATPIGWMTQIANQIGQKSLNKIVMPGTHDSATHEINGIVGLSGLGPDAASSWLGVAGLIGVAGPWAKAQNLSVKEQLQKGIRYFDLRVALDTYENKFRTCHTFWSSDLEPILKDIKNFLSFSDKNSREVIILDFQKLHAMTPQLHAQLIALIKKYLGDKAAPTTTLNPNSTMQDFYNSGKQVVILYGDDTDSFNEASKYPDLLWQRQNNIDSFWANTSDVDVLKNKLTNHVNKQLAACNPDESSKLPTNSSTCSNNKIFVMQGQITPDGAMIGKAIPGALNPLAAVVDWFGGDLNPMTDSLADAAEYVNPEMVSLATTFKQEGKRLNVVMVDYFDTEDNFVSNIIKLNS